MPETASKEEQLFTTKEACEYLRNTYGISRSQFTLRRWAKNVFPDLCVQGGDVAWTRWMYRKEKLDEIAQALIDASQNDQD